jgi:Fe-S cluster assembly iron-binding protein IscA
MTDKRNSEKEETAMVMTDPGVCEAIAEELTGQNRSGVIRFELVSTGCCDASLGLRLDEVRESDLVEKVESLTFVLSRDTYEHVGRVKIARRKNAQFVVTSEKPVSEWDGFGACTIK